MTIRNTVTNSEIHNQGSCRQAKRCLNRAISTSVSASASPSSHRESFLTSVYFLYLHITSVCLRMPPFMPPHLCGFFRRPLRLIFNTLCYAYFGYLCTIPLGHVRRLLRRYCFSSCRYRRVVGIGAIDSGRSRDPGNHVFRDRISLLKIHVF